MTSHAAHKAPAVHGAHAPHGHGTGHGRAIALFGGTFDPVHTGHIAVAQAAQRRFHLDAIYFVPSARPPHKSGPGLTPFVHRYAMVALACTEHRGFLPSLVEAPDGVTPHFFYTVDTVRRFRREHPEDHVYFIVGADQFLEIPTWKNYETLLDLCDFIIASRPGFRIDALRLVIPPEKLGRGPANDPQKITLRKSVVHLLTTVSSHVSSTEVRERLEQKKNIHGLVPARVEEYILGQALYR
ncbi:MAG TPA: nicotinate-nucleotide adenylyltransferase [Candidatus Limnocylindrales bacterium]|nr:nicotinate-nucleotide adenylyltransferase [Candidatus Limnocylindrales bacterium]